MEAKLKCQWSILNYKLKSTSFTLIFFPFEKVILKIVILFSEFQSVSFYNATLGHKINHNNEANTDYGFVDHPRFGKIR